ncbi:alpha/beta hydrolase [Halocatena halophila]|uniref:alpha/beta hydrolase n=1 Tax=Halocatena halophila TaxID=2814576 RepID=UPI002ED44BB4
MGRKGEGQGEETTVDRRSVLRSMAVGSTALSGTSSFMAGNLGELECLSAESPPDSYPVVEKDEGLFGGGAGFVQHGTFPDSPGEVVIYIHGWLELFTGRGAGQGYTLETALRQQAYDHPTITFAYPSNNINWWGVKGDAEDDGRAFASWVEDYRERYPDVTIRMVGHSLGARTGLGCLDELVVKNGNEPIESFAMIGGAIPRSAVTTDGEFATAITNGARRVDNFFSEGDAILDYIYQLGELGTEAVGAYGAPSDATTPTNYADHDVSDDVNGHCVYYKPDQGCVGDIVDSFEE